ncbi:UDP-N-acetylmuramoyl-L-alanyl-D-glutamate--2,6-diaminopimelate ligase [Arcobacter sp. FWKO B]|uniref:UDP-N-acetylmuramoyl-L-alanyl-D-glutamate--2, 6-diaminopimelate ligase n=1 Tax=Arcobacter sp. FWKO B TaxID=2593672 RepID=UPI0018A36702|nr:UDP-N-acetylmuramoyl-L-alanyl-D-glutamate--2,6-diaminopimelate ligase [Arcobacter sp. FWKO B]QOG12958.1 UDP-N-acetylmuramoyl-L-alanyl-D-glutamate--2,6-diaminopimelate ligase [Arcobacter sp. FWKO B]
MLLTINNKIFTNNSKEANKDTIFVCNELNRKFIDDARANGCVEFVEDYELGNFFDFSQIKIVGVTGTNGKTTTTAAIYSILLDLGYKVALQGTRGFFINDEKMEGYSLTTPMQLDIYAHIKKALELGCEFFVMEVSSHAIAQNRIAGLNFALKVHTNITRDHLDYHKTIEEYINVKNSFFTDESMKLINKDDKHIKYNIKNCFAYGLENPSTYKVSAYSLQNGIHVMLDNFENKVAFSSSMMGIFNIYNLTAAVASVHLLTKMDLSEICDQVENFGGVSGRMEIASTEPLIIIDFAHTPDGMEEVFKSFANKDIIAVFGAGGNRDKEKRPLMGKIASRYCKHIIITSDNPRFEDPDLIVNDILLGISNKTNIIVELNRKEAIKKAIQLYKKDTVILILGKGDEEYQIVYDHKIPFKDYNIVKELL